MPAAETPKSSTKYDDYGCESVVASSAYATSGPNPVCKRRRLQKNSVVILSVEAETNEGPISTDERDPPDLEIDNLSTLNYVLCSPIKCTKSLEAISPLEPVPVSNEQRRIWSNSERVVSVISKTDFSDATQYPSSDVSDLDSSSEDHSVKHACISTLRSQELLEVLGISGSSNSSQPCKLCGHSENILNMLICDNCEEAFHASCCNPRIKIVPIDEWFCHNCSKLKSKVSLEATFLKSHCISLERATSKFDLGPIAFMLKHPEKHKSRVRIGKAFQAEVPDWSGPISNGIDSVDEALEMDPPETISLHLNTNKCPKLNIMANWLQCREVLHDGSRKWFRGTICGKWRRAPLFEIQTDDWDCSCSVRWDPTHSDCAVPQELGTDQVLAHLKSLELLKPRLAVRRG
ncbi:hypothetical protein PVL29_004108 [Vitis rotundifolia]|uniref:Uncharacterized protein n=1 Tax=Vitis rotundifolia TaxID=103349 RepID=A0AA39A9B7_VITRO|nr:hypothetical protein PVL29_004108 [Vitis rotundifolia]